MWLLRGLRVAAILTPLLPARAGYALCQAIGTLYHIMNFRARRSIIDNLGHVEPRAWWFRRELLAARVCITVAKNYYDLLRLRSVDRENILDLIDVEGVEHVEAALERGKGLIIVSAHLGNFSVVARLPAALGYRSAIIAEEVKPAALFSYMVRLRSAMGIEVIPPGHQAVRRIFRLLRDNGILLVAGDRHVVGRGMATSFFDATTLLPYGPALLAMRTDASLLPAYTLRVSDRKSIVVLLPPLELARTGDWDADLRENVQRVTHALEGMIAIDPGQWAVLQRVWPPRSTFGRSEGLGNVDQLLDESTPDRLPMESSNDDIIPVR
jgi:phosphatidylinositol dimannoside acyltransferase